MPDNIKEKIEDKIIDSINLNAIGRLIVFKPQKTVKGVDLIIKKKGEYESRQAKSLAQNPIVKTQVFGVSQRKNTKEIQVCVNGQIKANDKSPFKKDIDIGGFKSIKNLYFIFAFFNILKQNIDDNICFVSLEEFKKNADTMQSFPVGAGNNILKFESFLSPDKKDKYSEFLVNKKDLAQFLLHIISPL